MGAAALALLNNIGVLSLGALTLFLIATRMGDGRLSGSRVLLLGLALGGVSFLVVKMPIPGPLGASFDTRAAPLVLAGFLGGGIGGGAAAAIAGIARYSVGGPAAIGGVLSVFLYAAAGWAGAAVAARFGKTRMGALGWAVLACAATVAVTPCFFVGQPFERGAAILIAFWPVLATGNLIGVMLLGLLVEEVQRFLAERYRNREQLHLSDLARRVARVGQWRHDLLEGRLEWDEAHHVIMGVEPQDFDNEFGTFRRLVHPDDWPAFARRADVARRTLGSYDTRVRIVTPAGDVRHVRISATCVGGTPGAPDSFFGLTVDETEDVKLRAELELKGAALDSARNGIVISSAEDGQPIVYVNEAFTDITGYPTDEVLGRNCRFLNRDLDADAQVANVEGLARVREAIRNGESCEVTLRNRRKDGTLFWNTLRISAIRDGFGLVSHFIGVQDDVTAKVEQRQAVVEARDQMQAILTAAPDAMLTVDSALRVTSFNKAAELLFGWREEDIMGQPVERLAPDEPGFDHRAMMMGHLASPPDETGPKPMGRIVDARRRDGTTFPAHVSLARFTHRGAPAITLMAHDMTEIVAAREKLEALSADLARQLEAAEAANEAKSQFLSVISHELRTPLNGILGMAGIMKATATDERQRQCVETILASGGALQQIVEDILDLTLMASGRLALDLGSHPISAIALRTVETAGVGASDRVVLAVDPTLSETIIVTDRQRLEQVLTNLLRNALKFSSDAPVTLSIGPIADGSGLRFEVRDEGVGVPVDKQDIIFHRFTQADQSVTRTFGGLGLGLSICREIVTALGGEIGVVSAPGEGATFWFELPDSVFVSPSGRPGAGDGVLGEAAGEQQSLESPLNARTA